MWVLITYGLKSGHGLSQIINIIIWLGNCLIHALNLFHDLNLKYAFR